MVAKRGLVSSSGDQFVKLERQELLPFEGAIKVVGLTQLDGQYVILVMRNVLGDGDEGEDDRGQRMWRGESS